MAKATMSIANSINWLIVPIVAPLALSMTACVLGACWGARLGIVAAVLVVASAGAVTINVWSNGPLNYPLGNWPVPLGIALYADGLSCAMLWMSAVVGAVVSVYARDYFAEPPARVPGAEKAQQAKGPRLVTSAGKQSAPADALTGQAVFWPLWLLLWCALHALFLSRDVFNLYVTLELLTLAAIGLVVVTGQPVAIEAALRYLLAALVGSLLYLAGVAVMYGAYGTLDITTLRNAMLGTTMPDAAAAIHPSLPVALLLVLLGLMLKSALFPFHFWLPPAHGSAPAPASALLSGLVVKGSFYILLRLWFELFPHDLVRPVAVLPTVLGAAAIVWGSLQALAAQRLKMLVAYSTVAQLGYLFLVFGLAEKATGHAAWSSGVLFALSHALAKGAMFLAAGTIVHVIGHDRVRDLSDASRRLPVTFLAIGVASVTLMGLPPSGAFVAKWTMLTTAIVRGQFGLAIIIVAGGLLAAGYLFRVLEAAFAGPSASETASIAPRVPRTLEYAALALATASVLLGLAAAPVIALIEIGSPWAGAIAGTSGP